MAKTTIYEMSKKNLAELTVNQLKRFIREASAKVMKDRESRYKAVETSANYITKKVGVRRLKDKGTGKYTAKLKLGFGKMKKADLLARARLLQGHFRVDVFSRNAREYRKQVTEQAIESFEKNTRIRLNAEEFAGFKSMVSTIRDLVEKYGSDNIAKMYDEQIKSGGMSRGLTLGSILRDVYENAPEGADKRMLNDLADEYLRNLYGYVD